MRVSGRNYEGKQLFGSSRYKFGRQFEWFCNCTAVVKLYREQAKFTRTDGAHIGKKTLMKLSYVYILKCADDTYYTGVTSNLSKRIDEHHSAKHPNSYTAKRLPVELVFYAEFTDINFAIDKEKQIKSWSRAKKEAAIEGRFEDLPNLAKKKFKK